MSYLENTFGLNGRRAVVTGAGRGIGRGIAEALAACGAEVVVHYNSSRNEAEEVVRGITASGGKAWSAQADLTKSAEVTRFFQQVQERWGALDILVNNTGDLIKRARVDEYPDDLLEEVLRVNIHSALYCIRQAAPLLRRGSDPCIVNLSSVAAHNGGGPGAVVYAATKGAIHTATRGLSKELAPEIRVNGIAPGIIMTDFHRKHSTAEFLETMKQQTPLKRLGEPEDCASAVVFLCSRGGSFITGEVIEVNGGIWLA